MLEYTDEKCDGSRSSTLIVPMKAFIQSKSQCACGCRSSSLLYRRVHLEHAVRVRTDLAKVLLCLGVSRAVERKLARKQLEEGAQLAVRV